MADEEALKEKWSREQAGLVEERGLSFVDTDLSFSVPVNEFDALSGADYDVPIVRQEDVMPGDGAFEGLKYVGGLDISYVGEEEESGSASKDGTVPDAFATVVVLAFPSLEVLHEVTQPVHLTTTVPYIPSFLSYREAPTYRALLQALRDKLRAEDKEHEFPQIVLVDGNGRLHVREAGSACVVGLDGGVPTIGVAKNYHPPHPSSSSPSYASAPSCKWRESQTGMRAMSQKVLTSPGSWIGLFSQPDKSGLPKSKTYIGAALRQPGAAKNPIFISSGHRVSLPTAIRLVLAVSSGTRVPEPIRKADFLSREAVRAALRGGSGKA